MPSAQNVRHLLYFFELLNQALEVKLESLFNIPTFLHEAMATVKSRSSLEQLTAAGENIRNHVMQLRRLIRDLGGSVEQEPFPEPRRDADNALTAMSFQEELAVNILEECQQFMQAQWRSSQMTSWVEELVATVLVESRNHLALFDRLFATVQPRFRDVVLERFRVTALP